MSLSFQPIYQNFIQLWSPFSRIEPVSEVYNEKINAATTSTETTHEKLILYNRKGYLEEYYYGNTSQFR